MEILIHETAALRNVSTWTTSSGKYIHMWDNGLNIDLSSKQLCADNSAWKYLHIYSKSSGTQSGKWRLRLLLCLVVSGCAIIVTTCWYAVSQERGIRVRWDSKRVLNCLCQSCNLLDWKQESILKPSHGCTVGCPNLISPGNRPNTSQKKVLQNTEQLQSVWKAFYIQHIVQIYTEFHSCFQGCTCTWMALWSGCSMQTAYRHSCHLHCNEFAALAVCIVVHFCCY